VEETKHLIKNLYP